MLLYRIRAIPFILSNTTCGNRRKGLTLENVGRERYQKVNSSQLTGSNKDTHLDNMTIATKMTSKKLLSCI